MNLKKWLDRLEEEAQAAFSARGGRGGVRIIPSGLSEEEQEAWIEAHRVEGGWGTIYLPDNGRGDT